MPPEEEPVSEMEYVREDARAAIRSVSASDHRMGRVRRTPLRGLMLAAALLGGVGGAGGYLPYLPYRPGEKGYEPTEADKERLRMAEEKRQRRAAKKAENTRRAQIENPAVQRIACPDCYGGHFRPTKTSNNKAV